ncbi:MAG: hypothetical protein NT004_10850, partial [Bacteroidetes bacterium]|nr:hypothetical protein [Bacteroidota bacterium]
MKRFLLYIFLAILSPATFAQVSISGDNSAPDPSAMLDVKSNSRGILLPRIALTAINMAAPVVAPAVGLMVYNTAIAGTSPHNVTHGYYLWDGSVWVPVSAIKGTSIGDMQYWNGFQWVNIPVGTPGQYLQLSSQNIPTWTGSSYPTVVTLPVTLVMQTTATSGGEILSDGGSSLSARGVCWNTTGNPTTADSKTVDGYGIGSFISNLTNLMPGTIYHVRAYATNTAGTSYGAVINFTTLNIPTVSTQFITSITQTTAQGGGHVTADGGSAVTHYGVCWSDNPDPTIGNSKTNDGSGIGLFTSNLTLLTPNTTYYVKAYATNSVGTAYGNQVVFTTLHLPELPVVYTSPVINITNLSAASGGDVTDDGDSPVTVRGVCWSLVQNPTTANNITLNGAGTGVFTSVLTGLLADTVYYIRAYATNISGTAYGNSLSFRTLPDAPPPCPGTPTVSYGGKTYNTVLIGSRCWFKENLDIGIRINGNKEQTDNNDTIEKYCFNNLEANCNIYGGLYQWNELMAYVNISEGMGICPAGWYVPGINEYITLINFLGGISVAGGKMKESGAEHWLSPNTDASNRSGFTGLPGSERSTGGTFPALGLAANIWTSSIYSSGFGALQLHYNSAAGDLIYANSDMGFSARCIKDTCSSHSSVGVIITPSVNPICSGAEVTLTATTTNSGTNPFFQWKINGIKVGTNTQIYSYIPANNDVVTCVLHSSTPCALNPAYSLPVTMIVNQNLPVSVSIAVSANPSCQGNLVAFTAMPTNGGSSPAYQWKVNGTNVTGATNSTFLSIPVNNEVILCILTSSEMCKTNSPATSNDIKMTVHNSEPVSVSIAATANPVCAGTSVTYTATPTNGGASPSYQWKLNGTNVSGATNATYSHIPANGNTIACILTSNLACSTGNPATSNSITMSVTESLPVSVSISASSNPICAGASVTFTATP